MRAPIFSTHSRYSPLRSSYIFSVPEPGVTNHGSSLKQIGVSEFDFRHHCSLPAMGCPARKRTPAFLRKAFLARSRTSNLVLPTSVSKVLGGRAGPSRSIISMIPLTGVANTISWLPCEPRRRDGCGRDQAKIAPLVQARIARGTGSAIAANDSSDKPSASSKPWRAIRQSGRCR